MIYDRVIDQRNLRDFQLQYDKYIISYIGFMQVIRADMTCLGFIFPELKVHSYNTKKSPCANFRDFSTPDSSVTTPKNRLVLIFLWFLNPWQFTVTTPKNRLVLIFLWFLNPWQFTVTTPKNRLVLIFRDSPNPWQFTVTTPKYRLVLIFVISQPLTVHSYNTNKSPCANFRDSPNPWQFTVTTPKNRLVSAPL